jgi:hypothetical protein
MKERTILEVGAHALERKGLDWMEMEMVLFAVAEWRGCELVRWPIFWVVVWQARGVAGFRGNNKFGWKFGNTIEKEKVSSC